MAVLAPPSGSALDTLSAGRWSVQVDLTPDTAPTWTWVNGLTSFEPSHKPKLESDVDITGDGWDSQAVTGNALTIAIEALVKGTTTGGVFTPDPGLNYLLQATKGTGSEAHVRLRYWHLGGLGDAYEVWVAVDASPKGGKPDELQKLSGSLIGRGKPLAITPPSGVYSVSVGAASAGSFTLTFGANTTAAIAYNAAASAVKSALVALDDGFSSPDWAVTGTAPNWEVTPPGNFPLSGTGTGLTGGALTVVQQ